MATISPSLCAGLANNCTRQSICAFILAHEEGQERSRVIAQLRKIEQTHSFSSYYAQLSHLTDEEFNLLVAEIRSLHRLTNRHQCQRSCRTRRS